LQHGNLDQNRAARAWQERRIGAAAQRAGPENDIMFRDRQDAGRQLAAALAGLASAEVVVLALPRGGVPVAFEVAARLQAPLDLVMVRKLGAPGRPELAIGAVADGGHAQRVLNDAVIDILRVPDDYVERETARQLDEIQRRRARYKLAGARTPLAGKTAIIVDDGIATGATVRAAIRSVRAAGAARVVVAAPVAAPEAAALLRQEADQVVVVQEPADLGGVGAFYADFGQLSDGDVVRLLDRAGRQTDASW
jgi:putative phosphoribosyl transferase